MGCNIHGEKVDKFGLLLAVKELKEFNENKFNEVLSSYVRELDMKLHTAQEKTRKDCFKYLSNAFGDTNRYDDFYLVFEYCLPLSGFRRPDVILFDQHETIVIEFKRKELDYDMDKQQLRGYLNELRNYHAETHRQGLNVDGCLVVTQAKEWI